jgi:DNA-binding MarR family transcriptional regulator
MEIHYRDALTPWMTSVVDYVRSGHADLTNRQMAVVLLVSMTDGPHTVRGIAKHLAVSKPVITRALNKLGALGYLRRERDDNDRRNIFIVPTEQGAVFLDAFGRLIADRSQPDQKRRAAA